MMLKLLAGKVARPQPLTFRSAYTIISRLFFKKKEEETLKNNKEQAKTPTAESPLEKED